MWERESNMRNREPEREAEILREKETKYIKQLEVMFTEALPQHCV